MKQTYEFTGKGKTIKISYEYISKMIDDTADLDGDIINFGKKAYTDERCIVCVDGKYYTEGTPTMIVKDGQDMLKIGVLYLTAERMAAMNTIIAETKIAGTELEAAAKVAEEKAKEEVKEIESAKATIAEAESQKDIPTESEYRAWRRNWNNIHNEGGEGFIPTRITSEQYEYAKSILNK